MTLHPHESGVAIVDGRGMRMLRLQSVIHGYRNGVELLHPFNHKIQAI